MRLPFVALVAVLAGACATPQASTPPPTLDLKSLTQADVAEGFRIAVVDACVMSIEGKTPIADLAGESGPIVRETEPDRVSMVKPKAGETVWSPRRAKGNVTIVSSTTTCRVQGFGPPMQQTFEAIGQALTDPHGFLIEPQRSGSQVFSKKVNGRTIRVALTGSDPAAGGAHYSSLTAVVSSS